MRDPPQEAVLATQAFGRKDFTWHNLATEFETEVLMTLLELVQEALKLKVGF